MPLSSHSISILFMCTYLRISFCQRLVFLSTAVKFMSMYADFDKNKIKLIDLIT